MVVGGEPPTRSILRFHTRCPRATDVCRTVEPPLAEYPGGHVAACHHPMSVSEDEAARATRSPLSSLSSGRLLPNGQETPEESEAAA